MGIDLARISVPVLLLHGRRGEAAAFSHGQWLAAHIPGVEAWLLDNEAHRTLRGTTLAKYMPGSRSGSESMT